MPTNNANDAETTSAASTMPLMAAADLQDHLMTASMDLDRLQTLLSDACDTLMQRFHGASEHIRTLREHDHTGEESDLVFNDVMQHLGGAVTALQFQDMASQLINHTHKRIRSCVDRLAREAFAEEEDGEVAMEEIPLRPNPVTQAEMDVGSVELF
ncbi:MAG TPA: hypothetical protein VE029_12815 [Rhizobacter sp.]|nr:hypothetical protein [Rhizobacter sp.]